MIFPFFFIYYYSAYNDSFLYDIIIIIYYYAAYSDSFLYGIIMFPLWTSEFNILIFFCWKIHSSCVPF